MPKGRQKNDGRGRLGGRVAGTPNKDNPLKVLLHEHSTEYFLPSIAPDEIKDSFFASTEEKALFVKKNKDRLFSQYEIDLMCMKAADRAKAELDLLAYHTPKMQAISADMSVKDQNKSFTELLLALAKGEDPKK